MKRYQTAAEAVFAEVPGGGVVLHTGTKRYYSLNETGARIWALLESAGDPDDTADIVAAEYEIPAKEAKQAVIDLVEGFIKAGLLREIPTA
jgi:hypothetical protein